MPGKVFISCGQRPPNEQQIALEVKELLENEFSLNPYLAFKAQSLADVMTITGELKSSDYFLFIDFKRRPQHPEDLPVSLFTHQELALAHHLGFKENIIALQEKGATLEGFLKYVLGNPEKFQNKQELISKLRTLVREKGWSAKFSRNLLVEELGFTTTLGYRDHTGESVEQVWQVRVYNHRSDSAAVGAVCILDYIIEPDGNKKESPDRSYLKWAAQVGYERTILPKDFGDVDLFSIRADQPGIFLHSLRDTPREPVVLSDGEYKFYYKIFSQGFPLVEFSVNVNLKWKQPVAASWENTSSASLIQTMDGV